MGQKRGREKRDRKPLIQRNQKRHTYTEREGETERLRHTEREEKETERKEKEIETYVYTQLEIERVQVDRDRQTDTDTHLQTGASKSKWALRVRLSAEPGILSHLNDGPETFLGNPEISNLDFPTERTPKASRRLYN